MIGTVALKFEGSPVQVASRDGELWFVAADVCAVLEISQTHRAVAGLDEDEKGRHTVTTPGGPQQVTVISESGLYSLVLRSRKPQARAFRRWVTHEVIPSIRRTGRFEATASAEGIEGPSDRARPATVHPAAKAMLVPTTLPSYGLCDVMVMCIPRPAGTGAPVVFHDHAAGRFVVGLTLDEIAKLRDGDMAARRLLLRALGEIAFGAESLVAGKPLGDTVAVRARLLEQTALTVLTDQDAMKVHLPELR